MKKSNIILLVVIAIAVAIIFSVVGDFSTYETFATTSANTGKEFHVIGVLDKDQPMQYDPQKDANYFSFYIEDKDGDVNEVVYHGEKPTDFERSEQIVLTGSMNDEGIFHASNILLKCPSKYTPDEEDLAKQVEARAAL